MKKSQLRQIIKEEIRNVLKEAEVYTEEFAVELTKEVKVLIKQFVKKYKVKPQETAWAIKETLERLGYKI